MQIEGDTFSASCIGAVHGEVLVGVAQGYVANGELPIGEDDVAGLEVPCVAIDMEVGGLYVEVEFYAPTGAECGDMELAGG